MNFISSIASGLLSSVVGPLFQWLTARANANANVAINANNSTVQGGTAELSAIQAADALNAKRSDSSPWTRMAIWGFLAPLSWHTWQVVLDSCRWVPTVEQTDWGIPYITIAQHAIGSWHIATLPGAFESTEQAVINSLFVGASALLAGAGIIRAIKR